MPGRSRKDCRTVENSCKVIGCISIFTSHLSFDLFHNRLTDEKDDVLKQLETERSSYAEKKSEMSTKYKQLLREKKGNR